MAQVNGSAQGGDMRRIEMLHTDRGQAPWEVALLIVAVAAAMLTMAIYAKRAVSGRLKDATQSISDAHYIYGRTSGTHNVNVTLQQNQRVISGEECEVDPDACEAAGDVIVTGTIARTAPYTYGSNEVRAQDFNVFVEAETTEQTTTSSSFQVSE